MPTEQKCNKCGAGLATFGAEALCPNCMLHEAVGLQSALSKPPAGAGLAASAAAAIPPVTEKSGDRIGRYKLLQQIGEGGMGVVYLAEQEEPVRRRVALKVIKLGMDTKQVIARFEAERQALALMDHPNIAKALDAGATDAGRPYFVMELVCGIRITDYCDQNHLTTHQRLDLFTQICRAIQHAHQKGIIHRDIKPSNILVMLHDGVPVPKIIDFGIAKATSDQRLTDKTLFTALEQFIGTPAYMSPEQARMGGLDIDTRSDIYSLGVLLYELLTGRTPFDTNELLQAGLEEMRRKIREDAPRKPSTRLSTMGEEETDEVTNCFKMSPTKLAALVRGDLDWIVMKALEKDRSRRYDTANGLAMDIQRHLTNEPVLARPPSRLYEFQKTVRRHKLGFAATGAVVVSLAVGLGTATVMFLSEREALVQTQIARQSEARLRQQAEGAEKKATDKLWDAYLAQAQAGRWSRRSGRRFEGLELLKQAAEIRPALRLRNEAIAGMALPDLRVIKEWDAWPQGGFPGGFDGLNERYVFGDVQGTVHLRRVQDEVELAQFPGYEPPFSGLGLSPDSRYLIVACGRQFDRVEVLDLSRKEVVLRLSERNYRTLAFSADSHLLAISYNQPASNWPVRIFDLTLKQQVASFNHGSLPYYLRFHPKFSNRLLSSDTSAVVRLWDWEPGRVLQTFSHPGWVQGIEWHPDGEVFAAGCSDNNIRLWDVASGQTRAVLTGHDWAVTSVTFSHDGAFLASSGWDGVVRLWDPEAKQELVSKRGSWISRFSTTGNQFVVNTGPTRIAMMEAVPGHGYRLLRSDLDGDERSVDCAFSPDGRLLISTHQRSVRVWDAAAGKEIAKIPKAFWTPSVVFHPDGGNLFLGAREGVENWLLEEASTSHFTLALLRRFDAIPQTSVISLTGDGRSLTCATDNGVAVIDTATGRTTARLKPAYGFVYAALSADGRLAATWTQSSTNVQIWNVARSNIVHDLPAHPSIYVAFSPNGQWIVVGDREEFHAWNIHTWQSLYRIPREYVEYHGVMAFSADSRILAVAISRNTVRLVEAATGRELATLEAPDRLDINWITFNADGTQLAVVGGSGPIQLWDLRQIRQELASMRLDWELLPLPPGGNSAHQQPLTVTVLGAK